MKLTVNMRLLAYSNEMSQIDYLRAESFAEWLLTVGEGRENTIPFLELPSGICLISIALTHI